jgi:hypothetical protein
VTPRFRRAALAPALALLAACGGDSSGPTVGPAANLVVVAAPPVNGVVKQSAGTFSVRVTDAGGRPVPNVAVAFGIVEGAGVTLSPSGTVSDAGGLASTTITLGTRTGTVTVRASAFSLATAVTASIAVLPGPIASVVATPSSLRFRTVGDSARITFALADQYDNAVPDIVGYTIGDSTLVRVDDLSGMVTALRAGDTTSIIMAAGGHADTVPVLVLAPGDSPCTGLATATSVAVGAPLAATASTICLAGDAASSTDFAVVAYNGSPDGASGTQATVTASGVGVAPTTARLPSLTRSLAIRAPLGALAPAARRDDRFHLRLLEDARALRRLFAAARATRNARLAAPRTPSTSRLSPSAPARSAIPGTAAVGDLLTLNVSQSPCNAPVRHGFRVAAVGTRAIVLADTLNPAGGFTTADYQRFAARFDTLVYPLDVGTFGAPSDLDANGKIAVLFTESVNELTPPNASSYVGGFFHPRDLFPRVATTDLAGCPASNEGEMFYMLVPDPAGTINGNVRSVAFVDTVTVSVIAHEFQHLINAGRRLYVNTSAQDFEETWLNEGLSHIAEELLYYRESGMQPRQNYGDAEIRTDPAKYAIWKSDASSNFARLLEYVEAPAAASPLDPDDALATRGATWSFLRYAVDRLFPSDVDVWARFDNSTDTGLLTIQDALLTDGRPLLADFAVANYLDDLGLTADPRYRHASWNFRDIFSNTFGSRSGGVFTPLGYYPIALAGLADDVASTASIRGSSAGYFRLTVPAGGEALLTFATGQGEPDPALRFIVVRTR